MKVSRGCRRFESLRSQKSTRAAGVFVALVLAGCTTTTPAPVIDRSARPIQTPPPAPIESRDVRSAPPATSSIPAQASSSGVTIGTAPSASISERTAPPSTISGAPLPPVAGNLPGNTPGSQFHVVQRGETLYRIALNNNVSVDSLAQWNNLNPTAPSIREGQVLRLRAPEDVRSASPASASAALGAPIVAPATGALAPSAPVAATPVAPASTATLKTEPRGQRIPYSDAALAQMQRADGSPASAGSSAQPSAVLPSAPPRPNESTSVGAAPSSTNSANPPPTVLPGATALPGEPEVRPGNGVDRDGVTWTWPTTGRLASKWNDRAAMKGVDLAAKAGTPVVAAASGKVIYVGKEPRGYGQMIVVSHAKETVSVYFHTDRVQVREQQRVTLGQKIAEISDGAGNKMHFEVRRQGRPVDPLTLMPAR